jgi:putative N6-adenine-specific DNA methylase
MITTPRGFVHCLSAEVKALGYVISWAGTSGVRIQGSMADAMRLNLHVRTGHRVLLELGRFRCVNADDLYKELSNMPWETIVPADGFVTVISNVSNETIRDTRFANLRAKDAIVDRIQRKKGRRPDSGPEARGAVVNLYWPGEECQVYLDTSGTPLSHRGYREVTVAAPMHETLAAAVIMTAGWEGKSSFANPMCGSGTIAIEAALMATRRAPGLTRTSFGFMHTLVYDKNAWQTLCREAAHAAMPCPVAITGCDTDRQAIKAAKMNAENASVGRYIRFEVADYAESALPDPPGCVIFNPEYGVRLGDKAALVRTYRQIGAFLKKRCQGFTGNLPVRSG